jgi:Dolichyl-phosphate-mannose-protein mannosyltransferase
VSATTSLPVRLRRAAGTRPSALLAASRVQVWVAGGQLLAGVGNLAFVVIAARVLPAGEFAELAAFVALLTALHLPGAALAASAALGTSSVERLERIAALVGTGAGALILVAASPLAAILGLPVGFVVALAAAAPAAGMLGLRRGAAYGARDERTVVRSLLAEPVVRLAIGLTLAITVGALGAAWGAVAGGWVALALLRRVPATAGVVVDAAASGSVATALAFASVALLQHQDLVVAQRVLPGEGAAAVAALSAVGGIVAFATATLPMVLLPRARAGEPHALEVALTVAGGVAVSAVAIAAVAGQAILEVIVGARYSSVAPLLPAYLAAMGALGVVRVLAAHRAAVGCGRRVAWWTGTVVVAHATALVLLARTPGQVVAVTGLSLATALVGLSWPAPWAQPSRRRLVLERVQALAARPDARLVAVLTALAVAVRLATERSLWIDEAVSLNQAQMGFADMLANLRTTDVHPPLHHVVLWATVRVLGTAEWAVRLPSVFAGAALVPVLYGTAVELYDRPTARVAAVLAVPAPFLVWYSQEARMYALFMLFGVLGVWAQTAALRRGGAGAFVGWGVASAALLWTQWFAVLPLMVQHAVAAVHLVRTRRQPGARRRVGGWLGAIALTLLLLVPLVPYLGEQLAAYGERGAGLAMPASAGADASSVATGLSPYALIANLLWALGGYHSDDVMLRLGSLWPLGLLGALLLLGRRLEWQSRLLLVVALVPGAALFAIAHTKRDLFELRYFVLAVPLLLLLGARAVTTAARGRAVMVGLTAALVLASTVALVDQQLNGTNPRLYDFRGAVADIDETSHPGDSLIYAPHYLEGVLGYYAPELEGAPLSSIDAVAPKGQVYVMVVDRFLTPTGAKTVGDALARLEEQRGPPVRMERPNIVIWRFA